MVKRPVRKPRRRKESIFHLGSTEKRDLAIILLITVVLRFIYLVQYQHSFIFGKYVLDSMIIDRMARSLASGNFWGDTAFFRAPLYIYLVALVYKIFGTGSAIIILLQDLLSLATVIVTYFYARYLFDVKAARWTGVLMACWPTLIYFSGELMITTLAVFLAVVAVFSAHRALDTGRPRTYLLAGILLGLAAITRPTFLPLIVIIPLALYFSGGKKEIGRILRLSVIYIVGVIIPIAPVTIRNLAVADDFVLISTQGGVNFFIGNNREADGISVSMPALGPIMEGGQYGDNVWTSSVQIARKETGRNLSQSEVSSYWLKRGMDEIFADPGHAIGLLAAKFYYFWHGQEIFNNKSPYYSRDYSWLMKILLWKYGLNFPSGLMFPLMFVGIFYALRAHKKVMLPVLFLLIFCVTVALFFVCSRFRQPVMPIAIPFAVYAVYRLLADFKQKHWRHLLYGGSATLLLIVAMNLGGDIESVINRSQNYTLLGTFYFGNGDYDKAIAEFHQALEIDPGNAQAYGSLGAAYGKAGKLADAEQTLTEALKYHPGSPTFHFNLGLVYMQSGRLPQARQHFEEAIKLDATSPRGYFGLAHVFEEQGHPDSAIAVYQTLLKYHPENQDARDQIQQLQAAEKQ